MTVYQYSALRFKDKSRVQGTINAETERQVRELLRDQELYPTSIKVVKEKEKRKAKESSRFQTWISEKIGRIGIQEKITFTQNMEMMVKAGIPITEALLYMESYMDNVKFKRMVNTIRLDILSGYSFSRALAKHAKIFNDIYVGIVQAGEASGELETVLKRLGDILIGEARLRKKVISAMVYPVIVVAIATIVLLIMFIFVLPTFSEMYFRMGVKLPLITQVMVGISQFLRSYWYICLLSVIGAALCIRKYLSTSSGKASVDKALLGLPVFSPLITAVCCTHFIATLNVSFSAGLPITDCIMMACQTVTHTTIREAFDEVNLKIQSGQRLASAMAETHVLPAVVVIMISTGEESGALEEMFNHCLEYLENEVNHRVEVMMSMMEPALLIVLGILVGFMALSIYLPLFSMYEHIH